MSQLPVKLLLIEDSINDVELTLMSLEVGGMIIKPVVVHDHHGARDALSQQTFDVIVCDYLLPSSSGLEVFEVAKHEAPETPFIFLSGIFREEQAAESLRLGGVDYVLKKNLKTLVNTIKRAVSEVQERKGRIKAETALEEIEARARLAIEAAEMGVWEVDLDTDQVIWDDRCKALYELLPNAQPTLGQALGFTHPDDVGPLKLRVEEVLREPSMFTAEYRIVLTSQRVRWLYSNGRSVFREGRCVRFSGVIQDITERKNATQQLEQQNEALGFRVEQRTLERDQIWEFSHELLAILRFDLSPIAFNPAWERTLGWSPQQIEKLRFWELVHPDDLDATIRETENIASGNVSIRFVNRMRHINGDYRWLSWTVVPKNEQMYAAVRDITEERAVLEELASINRKLVEQMQEREKAEAALQQMQRLEVVGQLTAGVAHDFNNLLTVILTGTALAERACKNGQLDKVTARLQAIKQAGERGAKLTAQLLSFSRRQRLEPIAVNLSETIQGMSGLLLKALGPDIYLNTSIDNDLWMALADPTQTEMIILNLCINAKDAMTRGGNLTLAAYNKVVNSLPVRPEHPEPGEYVVISVSDNGCGMTPDILQRAFEPFFTTKAVGKGSGLGLAQVFGFSKQSGGGITVKTAPNIGTTFEVFLPATASVYASNVIPKSTTQCSPQKMAKILLVDDDDAVRAVTAMMLESLGHTIIEARSGPEAIGALVDNVDLIVTDYAMPGMSGIELAEKIAALSPQLPVVLITGYADTDGLGLAEARVLQKPFTESDLREKIYRALDGE